MKRTLLLSITALAFWTTAKAQLTLTSSNVTIRAKTEQQILLDPSSVLRPKEDSNAVWDFTGGTVLGSTSFSYLANKNSAFPSKAVVDTNRFEYLISTAGYLINNYITSDSTAFGSIGQSTERQVYPIGKYTGNNNDTLIVRAQNVVYPEIVPSVAFPASLHSQWFSIYDRTLDFTLTITAAGLSNSLFQKKSSFLRVAEVVGDGVLKVKGLGNSAAAPVSCLMVKRGIIQKDSFFVNGSPAPTALLSSFGLSQGMETYDVRYIFYAAKDQSPVMVVNFGKDTSFTNMASITYNAYNLTGIADAGNSKTVTNYTMYPNPSVNSNVNVKFSKASAGVYTITLVNALGQLVKSVPVSQAAGEVNMKMDLPKLSNGTYFMNITNDKGQIEASSKLQVVNN